LVADRLPHLAVHSCFSMNSIVMDAELLKGRDSRSRMYPSNTRTLRAFSAAVEITAKELAILIKAIHKFAV
jgi:hypothetical protein